ncbi:hypothetical protein [Saccharicrinis aurantiacus]|uniref:hypothetical protein n=1 Tax=Saccharicrinis aurantiacus TaxID=1849719 RepID=UPI00094F6CD0|nr:hypothetical protein [Saccharicrinis aurantiacus]
MKKGKFIAGKIILMLLGVGLVTLAVLLLWNWLMPAIFGLTIITYWQALGLLALSKILFSGFGRGHSCSNKKKKNWRGRFGNRCSSIPKEKRAEYMQKMKDKGFGSHKE